MEREKNTDTNSNIANNHHYQNTTLTLNLVNTFVE